MRDCDIVEHSKSLKERWGIDAGKARRRTASRSGGCDYF